jgi:hypothetical protein
LHNEFSFLASRHENNVIGDDNERSRGHEADNARVLNQWCDQIIEGYSTAEKLFGPQSVGNPCYLYVLPKGNSGLQKFLAMSAPDRWRMEA